MTFLNILTSLITMTRTEQLKPAVRVREWLAANTRAGRRSRQFVIASCIQQLGVSEATVHRVAAAATRADELEATYAAGRVYWQWVAK